MPENRDWILHHPPLNAILRLSSPMLAGTLALLGVEFLDAYFISLLGVKALTAYSYALPITTLLTALGIAFSIVVTSLITHNLGAGRYRLSNVWGQLSCYLATMTAIIVCIAGLISLNLAEPLFNQHIEEASELKAYLSLRLIGFIFFLPFITITAIFRALGQMHLAARLFITFAITQITLELVMALSLPPFSQWSLTHAGSANLAATLGASLIAAFFLYRSGALGKKIGLKELHTTLLQQREAIRNAAHMLASSAVVQVMTPFALLFLTWIIAQRGDEGVAALGVFFRLEQLILILPMLLTTSLPVFIGQNWGCGYINRVRQGWKLTVFACVSFQIVLAIILWNLAHFIAGHFCGETQVRQIIEQSLSIVPVSFAGLGIALISISATKAMGLANDGLNLSLKRFIILLLPACYIGEQLAGVTGFFIGMAIANFLIGLICFRRLNQILAHAPTNSAWACSH